jgi:hypothetical protein
MSTEKKQHASLTPANKGQKIIVLEDDGQEEAQRAPIPYEDRELKSDQLTSSKGGRMVRASRRLGRGDGDRVPPELNATPILRSTFRFYANATVVSGTTSLAQMMLVPGGIGTVSNSTIATFATSFKINKISVWCPTGSSVATTEVYWNATADSTYFGRDEEKCNSVPAGVTLAGAMVFVPPKGSMSAQWLNSHQTSSTNIITWQIPVGSIIDVDLSYVLGNNFLNFAVSGFSTVSVGSIYYGYLDGKAGGKLAPFGRPATS